MPFTYVQCLKFDTKVKTRWFLLNCVIPGHWNKFKMRWQAILTVLIDTYQSWMLYLLFVQSYLQSYSRGQTNRLIDWTDRTAQCWAICPRAYKFNIYMIKVSSPMFTSAKEVHVYYYAYLLCILNSIYCELLCSFDLPARAVSHDSVTQSVQHCDLVSFFNHLQKKEIVTDCTICRHVNNKFSDSENFI